ncbi:hypothetical protein Tco_0355231 [Tanacetum coccineum]
MELSVNVADALILSRPNFNAKRQRKFYAKQEMLRNANAFAENLFQKIPAMQRVQHKCRQDCVQRFRRAKIPAIKDSDDTSGPVVVAAGGGGVAADGGVPALKILLLSLELHVEEEIELETKVDKEENEVEAESDQEDEEVETKPEIEGKLTSLELKARNQQAMTDPSNRWSKERRLLCMVQLNSLFWPILTHKDPGSEMVVSQKISGQKWWMIGRVQTSRENSGKWKVKTEDVVDVFQAYFGLCARNVRSRHSVDLPTTTAAEFRYEEIPDSEVFRKYTDLCATSVTTTRSVNSSARLQAKVSYFLFSRFKMELRNNEEKGE